MSQTVAEILSRLEKAGIRVSMKGPDTLWLSPKDRITDELRALVRAHKPELLVALASPQTPAKAVSDSREEMHKQDGELYRHFQAFAATLEAVRRLPRIEAELEASRSTFLLARGKGYTWRSLRYALPGEFSNAISGANSKVSGPSPWGLPRYTMTPTGEPIQQGVYTVESLQ